MFQAKIDKEIVRDLPIARTDCEIVIIDSNGDVENAIEELCKADIIGFDTETKPSFAKGVVNKVSLLQLSTDKQCFLFRLKKIGRNKLVKNFLEDESIKKIGIGIRDDFSKLNSWGIVNPKSFVDLQQIVKNYGIEELGLQRIYAIIFGKKISKRQQLSNWDAKILNREQQIYAATDAWACREIYLKLTECQTIV